VDSEQEELEALQKWWKENGRAVAIGLILGLGGVFGWTTWQARVEAAAEEQSVAYQNLADTAALGNHVQAVPLADAIIAASPDSEYAALAGLLGARSALHAGQPDTAERLLDWVIDNAARADLSDVARIRRAQLLFGEGERDAALDILVRVANPAFAATVEELRGDIMVENNEAEAAAKAYESALASDTITSGMRARVQMKLDDLGHDDALAATK